MAELPWRRADRDIKRVERDLTSLRDELREHLSRLETEIDNDTNEMASVIESARSMMNNVDTELERVKRSVGCNEARIVNLEDDVFEREVDDIIDSRDHDHQPSLSPASSSLESFEDDTNSVYFKFARDRKMSRLRQAAMANMANMRNHGVDLFLYTAIVSLCACGLTYLYMTY
jgi:chromosome segregation ATPase